jgi:hypothetical protein
MLSVMEIIGYSIGRSIAAMVSSMEQITNLMKAKILHTILFLQTSKL